MAWSWSEVCIDEVLPANAKPNCDFSHQRHGSYSVPASGCRLTQVVQLRATHVLTLSGSPGANPLAEVQAVGGDPVKNFPRRHFYVPAEAELVLEHLQLTRGRIWVESQSIGSVGDAGGGSIWVVGASARFTATNVLFLGCNDLYCSKGGGAIYVDSGAEIIISDSTFRNNKATWTAGAISLYNGKGTFRNTRFEHNKALHFSGALGVGSTSEAIFEGGNNSMFGNQAPWGRSFLGTRLTFTNNLALGLPNVCNRNSFQHARGIIELSNHATFKGRNEDFQGCPMMVRFRI